MSRVHRHRHRAVAALSAWLAFPLQPGWAADPAGGASPSTNASTGERGKEAMALRERAEELYFEDDFEGALQAFQQAHDLDPHPSDLFNMGRIYEERGELSEALARYEEFASMPRIPLEQRAAAGERIKVLRVLVEEEEARQANAGAELDRDDLRAQGDRAAMRTVVDGGGGTSPRVDRQAKIAQHLIVSGSVLTAFGAAIGLGGGLAFGLLSRRHSERVEALESGENPGRLTLSDAEDLHARGRDYEALQISSLATGGTLAGVGLGLLITGVVRRQSSSRATAWLPQASPNGFGLQTRWRF